MKYEEFYELKGENEENTFGIAITNEMSPDDVVQKILDIVDSST